MSVGWEVKKLSEVCLIRPPKSEARKRLNGSDLVSFVPMEDLGIDQKVLTPSKVRPFDKVVGGYTYFADEDVLLAKITPCFENGKLGIARNLENGVGFGSSEFIVFRPDESLENDFLYYFLTSYQFREEGAQSMRGAVGHKRVDKEFIENYQLPIPPIEEQRRIVTMLDEAMTAVSTAIANTERNLVNGRELFTATLQSIFANPPASWEMKTLGEVSQHSLGKMLDKQKNRGTPKKIPQKLKCSMVQFDLSDMLEMRFLEEETEKYTAVKGDLLICEGGYPGRAAIWEKDYPVYFQKAIHRVRFHKPEYTKWFLYFLYLSDRTREIEKYFTGTGIQHFTGESLHRLVFPVASLSEMKAIVAQLDDLAAQTGQLEAINQQKLAALTELKQSILQQAFTQSATKCDIAKEAQPS